MAAYRCVFNGTTCELRTEPVDRRRWVARPYVVQESSLVLQSLPCNGTAEFEGESEQDAVARAVNALTRKLGRPYRDPLPVSEDPAFRVVDRARTA
jgi:hypothetical protein